MLAISGAGTIGSIPFDAEAGMLATSGAGTIGSGSLDVGAGMLATCGAGAIGSGSFNLGDGGGPLEGINHRKTENGKIGEALFHSLRTKVFPEGTT